MKLILVKDLSVSDVSVNGKTNSLDAIMTDKANANEDVPCSGRATSQSCMRSFILAALASTKPLEIAQPRLCCK